MKTLVFCAILMLSLGMAVAAAPRAHELENEILRTIRSAATPDGTWRVAVLDSDNNIVVSVGGTIWNIAEEASQNAEHFTVVRDSNYTVIAQGLEGANFHNANSIATTVISLIGGQRINSGNIIKVNDINYIATLQNGIVYVSRPTCSACVAFSRTLFDAALSAGVQVYYLDTDMWRGHPQISHVISTQFGVTGVPFLASVKNGEISVIRHSAYADLVTALRAIEFDQRTLRFAIGSTTFTDNGAARTLEAAPFIASDRTMVPLRVIAEALGATNLGLANNVVSFNLGGTAHNLQIGQPLPGGIGTPVIVEGRTFVPLRYVINVLGTGYRWDAANRVAYVII